LFYLKIKLAALWVFSSAQITFDEYRQKFEEGPDDVLFTTSSGFENVARAITFRDRKSYDFIRVQDL